LSFAENLLLSFEFIAPDAVLAASPSAGGQLIDVMSPAMAAARLVGPAPPPQTLQMIVRCRHCKKTVALERLNVSAIAIRDQMVNTSAIFACR
jgi:hypothetical protein